LGRLLLITREQARVFHPSPIGLAMTTPISLTLGASYTQNFDTLSNVAGSTTNALSIPGWAMNETGGGARDNDQYAVDNGGSNVGETYSYGAAGSTERALGSVQSGLLIPSFGAVFSNDTGRTINSLVIAFTGEEWRLGTAGRTDLLRFEYSLDATDLTTGTWTNVAALNFITPDAGTVGAKDGNASGERTALSATVQSLDIKAGQTFWLRWTDSDASGADDGLAIDNFSLSATVNSDPSHRVSDFNGDGFSDALLRDPNGNLWLNLYRGATIVGSGPAGSPTTDWDVVATADFNGDGRSDVALRNHASGQFWFNFYNGTNIVGSGPAGSPTTDWDVAGTGDFNGDGKSDMLLRNHASGALWLNLYNGVNIVGSGPAGSPSTDWDVAGIGDFNADGFSDVVLRNHNDGRLWINLYNGVSIVGSGPAGSPALDWDFAGIGDFNGDGKSDVMLRNHASGQLWINLYDGLNMAGSGPAGSPSTVWDVVRIADYNGDNHSDVMLRNHLDGSLYVNFYNGLSIAGSGPAGSPTTDWHFISV
jgi:hypothetical protein